MTSNAPSRAALYFEKVKALGAEFLKRCIGSQTPTYELEFLEFKGASHLLEKRDDLKDIWAKNLSCFANSEGGVLIFGIDAPNGFVKSLSPVRDLTKFQELLKNWLSVLTEPPVLGVDIILLEDPPSSNTGFIVCHIPASTWRPHQTRPDGQPEQFYIRAGDNCIPCSQSTLRTLFYPQFVASLEIYYHVNLAPAHKDQDVVLHCFLNNGGPGTAEDAFVHYEHPKEVSHCSISRSIWKEVATARAGTAMLALQSIHPTQMVPLINFTLGRISPPDYTPPWASIEFKFSLYARHQSSLHFKIVLSDLDVHDSSRKKALLVPEPSR